MRYLLIEQPGPWAADGFASAPVPTEVRDGVLRRARAIDVEVLLIERVIQYESPVCLLRSWCAVDTTAPDGQRIRWGAWAYPNELLAGIDRLELLSATDASAAGAGPDLGFPGPDDPIILVPPVLADGTDSRALARTIAARWPEPTWLCSAPPAGTGPSEATPADVLLLPAGTPLH